MRELWFNGAGVGAHLIHTIFRTMKSRMFVLSFSARDALAASVIVDFVGRIGGFLRRFISYYFFVFLCPDGGG